MGLFSRKKTEEAVQPAPEAVQAAVDTPVAPVEPAPETPAESTSDDEVAAALQAALLRALSAENAPAEKDETPAVGNFAMPEDKGAAAPSESPVTAPAPETAQPVKTDETYREAPVEASSEAAPASAATSSTTPASTAPAPAMAAEVVHTDSAMRIRKDQTKKLRKMSRLELIDVIYNMALKNRTLANENDELQRRLEDVTIRKESAGSIAEAAVAVHQILQSAQDAADEYIASVKASIADPEMRDKVLASSEASPKLIESRIQEARVAREKAESEKQAMARQLEDETQARKVAESRYAESETALAAAIMDRSAALESASAAEKKSAEYSEALAAADAARKEAEENARQAVTEALRARTEAEESIAKAQEMEQRAQAEMRQYQAMNASLEEEEAALQERAAKMMTAAKDPYEGLPFADAFAAHMKELTRLAKEHPELLGQ